MHLAGDALAFGHDRQLAKAGLEPRVLDRDRSLVGERRERLELVDLEAALVSRADEEQPDRLVGTLERRLEAGDREVRPDEPGGVLTGEATRPVDRIVRPDAATTYGSASGRWVSRMATSAPSRSRAWSTIASRISSRSSRAAIATLTRCRARADASRRSRLAFRARSSADSASIRRKAMAENVQAMIDDEADDDDRVDREWEQAVEQAVADDLDDRDRDHRDDDAQPAQPSHRARIGRRSPEPAGRAT